MLITELIAKLEELKGRHGDLPVLIEQKFDDCPRMSVEHVSAEITHFENLGFEELEQMEDMNIVNSIVITDEP